MARRTEPPRVPRQRMGRRDEMLTVMAALLATATLLLVIVATVYLLQHIAP